MLWVGQSWRDRIAYLDWDIKVVFTLAFCWSNLQLLHLLNQWSKSKWQTLLLFQNWCSQMWSQNSSRAKYVQVIEMLDEWEIFPFGVRFLPILCLDLSFTEEHFTNTANKFVVPLLQINLTAISDNALLDWSDSRLWFISLLSLNAHVDLVPLWYFLSCLHNQCLLPSFGLYYLCNGW